MKTAVEAPREAASEAREGHETVSEGSDKGKAPSEQQEPPQHRSWWRQFFGLQ